MNFERLSNELLIDTFKYFNGVHLLKAFSNLNTRLNHLLIIHFQTYGLDLQSISKSDYDNLCQQNLPWIANYITGLRLSDDDDTPNQINLFLSQSLTFEQLKKLSLYHISSFEIIKKVLNRFHYLTHFDLINCHLQFRRKTLRNILNRLWILPELIHVRLQLSFNDTYDFPTPTFRSKSIQYLIIDNILLKSTELIRLFRSIPQLRHLTVMIDEFSNDTKFPSKFVSISSLKLTVDHLTNGAINLLKNMPNLTSLTLQIGKNRINGHQWKQLFINYLPKIKIFRFLMLFNVKNEEQMNKIFDSYQTSYWINEREWYIRCHWKFENNHISVLLYTLPYTFSYYTYLEENSNGYIKSTCPNEDDYCSYNRVTKLAQHLSTSNDIYFSRIRFYNIQHLELVLPIHDELSTILPRLDPLITLKVSCDEDDDVDGNIVLSQLQNIINQASRLQDLIIGNWNSSSIQEIPLHINSTSIRRLDLQSYHYFERDRCFNSEQCKAFLSTSLAKQCQVLQIVVNDKSDINELINGMPKLQALKVVFEHAHWNNYLPGHEDLFTWMISGFSRGVTENLPGTETYRLWIR
ncbi:unnamed protein product [Rotaria sp. Silwood1]|nr:unnamed protein product [Rotaria sp. Silwood1]CAF4951027.1 unnamed protein product [Rotaria sp. Silwood1]